MSVLRIAKHLALWLADRPLWKIKSETRRSNTLLFIRLLETTTDY
jgi:hypothetical protein